MAKILSAVLVLSAVAVFLVESNGHHNFGGHPHGPEHTDFVPGHDHGNNEGETGSSSVGVGENSSGSSHVSSGISENENGKSSGEGQGEENSQGHQQSGGEQQHFGGYESHHEEDFGGHEGSSMYHDHSRWDGGHHGRH